jgi:tryptophan 7-halogenase
VSSKPLEKVVIVGGGSAGWLTAALVAAAHQTSAGPALKVTLIESPDVAPVGVGEGTWPSMRETLHRIGVFENDFFCACDASFKQGSLFVGWVDGSDDDAYYHPFELPHGYGETNLAASWQRQHGAVPFADLVSVQPHLCRAGKAPKQATTPEFAAVANYGYHLDAAKFGLFLRRHCTEKLGVIHVPDHVVAVHAHDDGDIASVQTKLGGAIEGDLFIDCSGSQALLLGKHYGVPLLPQKHILFNDRACVVQLGYPEPTSPIASQTKSTAQEAGWIWDIGLPIRRGIGHVYSSATPATRRPSRPCWPTSNAAAVAHRCSPRRASSASNPATATISGTATAWPSASRPGLSSRSRRRHWRWWSCPPPCSATACRPTAP